MSYGDAVAVATRFLEEAITLQTLVNNIGHVGRQGKNRSLRPVFVISPSFIRMPGELKKDSFRD